MKLFKKILCPVDFSESSRHAMRYAKTFAKIFDSELAFMHVSPNVTEAYTALMPDFPNYGLKKEDLIEQFNEFTDDWSGKLTKVIRAGTPYIEILEYAKEDDFDLIILGAKGHSKFERLFLGVTGEKVARKSQCPVLTVHDQPVKIEIKKILLPIDFSQLSYAVLPMVASLAKKFKAEINLLHVVEIGHHMAPEEKEKEYEYLEKIKERLAEQWELPDEIREIETKKFIRHFAGSAGYGILEFAQDWDIDLITMATHGRSGLSKVLLGSVTEKVIKIAQCPVLSVRSVID
jgi:nucleotide-binding universal stress UspA family protein